MSLHEEREGGPSSFPHLPRAPASARAGNRGGGLLVLFCLFCQKSKDSPARLFPGKKFLESRALLVMVCLSCAEGVMGGAVIWEVEMLLLRCKVSDKKVKSTHCGSSNKVELLGRVSMLV